MQQRPTKRVKQEHQQPRPTDSQVQWENSARKQLATACGNVRDMAQFVPHLPYLRPKDVARILLHNAIRGHCNALTRDAVSLALRMVDSEAVQDVCYSIVGGTGHASNRAAWIRHVDVSLGGVVNDEVGATRTLLSYALRTSASVEVCRVLLLEAKADPNIPAPRPSAPRILRPLDIAMLHSRNGGDEEEGLEDKEQQEDDDESNPALIKLLLDSGAQPIADSTLSRLMQKIRHPAELLVYFTQQKDDALVRRWAHAAITLRRDVHEGSIADLGKLQCFMLDTCVDNPLFLATHLEKYLHLPKIHDDVVHRLCKQARPEHIADKKKLAAKYHGNSQVLQLLLEKQLVSIMDVKLDWSAVRESSAIVALLPCRPDTPGTTGTVVAGLGVGFSNTELLNLLEEVAAKLPGVSNNVEDDDEDDAMSPAEIKEGLSSVEHLIKKCTFSSEHNNAYNTTILHMLCSVRPQSLRVAALLELALERGADAGYLVRYDTKQTPLMARGMRGDAVEKLLLAAEAAAHKAVSLAAYERAMRRYWAKCCIEREAEALMMNGIETDSDSEIGNERFWNTVRGATTE
jgi:hypothetical protein